MRGYSGRTLLFAIAAVAMTLLSGALVSAAAGLAVTDRAPAAGHATGVIHGGSGLSDDLP